MKPSSITVAWLEELLAQNFPKLNKIVVGFSGGLDSTVLLHLLSQSKYRKQVIAVHVNYGISCNADSWQSFCESFCAQQSIQFVTKKFNLSSLQSNIEAQARKLRYDFFTTQLISAQDVLMTAHHKGDQAETFLLHLMRGAGVNGLAGIQQRSDFAAGKLFRPLLAVERNILAAYAAHHNLTFCDDESNASEEFSRNFVRHQVLPALELRWPHAKESIIKSATYAREAAVLLDDLARLDLQSVLIDAHCDVAKLALLSCPRQKNLLRFWSKHYFNFTLSEKNLNLIVSVMINARHDSLPQVTVGEYVITRHQNRLMMLKDSSFKVCKDYNLHTKINDSIFIAPLNKKLALKKVYGAGIAPEYIVDQNLTIKFRQGGEKILLHQHKMHKKLKNLFQEDKVQPWVRDATPLVYLGDKLLAVVGFWYDARYVVTNPKKMGFEVNLV